MIDVLPPGVVLLLGGVVAPLLRGRWRTIWLVGLPVLSFLHMWSLPEGALSTLVVFGYELAPVRADRLAFVFGTVFHLAALLSAIYSLRVSSRLEDSSALLYAAESQLSAGR